MTTYALSEFHAHEMKNADVHFAMEIGVLFF